MGSQTFSRRSFNGTCSEAGVPEYGHTSLKLHAEANLMGRRYRGFQQRIRREGVVGRDGSTASPKCCGGQELVLQDGGFRGSALRGTKNLRRPGLIRWAAVSRRAGLPQYKHPIEVIVVSLLSLR